MRPYRGFLNFYLQNISILLHLHSNLIMTTFVQTFVSYQLFRHCKPLVLVIVIFVSYCCTTTRKCRQSWHLNVKGFF